jgi:hypothetical protein
VSAWELAVIFGVILAKSSLESMESIGRGGIESIESIDFACIHEKTLPVVALSRVRRYL